MRKPQSIQSIEARNLAYQQSIENPEVFWGDIAEQSSTRLEFRGAPCALV